MKIIHSSEQLQKQLSELRKIGTIGFVPTMGALHKGHLTLVEKAVNENDTVVVSIFVNPTQFNDKEDLLRYPRNLKQDTEILKLSGCHVVFAPLVDEIYPEPDKRIFDFDDLDKVLEGKFRPGHFNGVAQVVSRLFDIVWPDSAYFGLKDFQQLAIIKLMVSKLNYNIEIIPCPTIREESGLAMSSRNLLLSDEERKNAAIIYETLTQATELAASHSVFDIKKWIGDRINNNPFLDVEYVELVDETSLKPVECFNHSGRVVCCVAVWCGKIRLIDNVYFS